MKFGRIPTAEAAGALLAHSVKVPGGAFKKGRRLSDDDIAKLAEAGVETVVAARLEPGDIGEDDAAAAVAAPLAGENVSTSAAFTGRVNLFAELRGLATVDAARLDRMNRLDEAITIATVPSYTPVGPKQMVATIKIIPFAAPGSAVGTAVELGNDGGPLIHISPFTAKRVALIQSRNIGMKESVLDKTVVTTRGRVEALGGTLVAEQRCDHDERAIAAAILDVRAHDPDIVLIAGSSAIVDRRDVLPAGIELAGGEIVHFGMPVDPGNLILMGKIAETDVVGLPGCARSPKFNGFDWVLQRLFANLPVARSEIMGMGAGGLLTDIPTRPLPRTEATSVEETAPAVPRAPRIAAVVLAGGLSRRMGVANKLLTEVDGTAMVVRAVETALASKAHPVIVITGHEADAVKAALGDRPVAIFHNPDYASGLSTTLRRGIQSVPDSADGAIVLLGDMPRVTPAHLDRLIAAFNPVEGRAICVPTYNGKQGNPVLWARRFFADMTGIAGDVGAKHLIGANPDLVAEVAMPDSGVLLDIDTPEALAAYKASNQPRPCEAATAGAELASVVPGRPDPAELASRG